MDQPRETGLSRAIDIGVIGRSCLRQRIGARLGLHLDSYRATTGEEGRRGIRRTTLLAADAVGIPPSQCRVAVSLDTVIDERSVERRSHLSENRGAFFGLREVARLERIVLDVIDLLASIPVSNVLVAAEDQRLHSSLARRIPVRQMPWRSLEFREDRGRALAEVYLDATPMPRKGAPREDISTLDSGKIDNRGRKIAEGHRR